MSISVVYVLRDNPEEMSRNQLHGHKSGDLLDKKICEVHLGQVSFSLVSETQENELHLTRGTHHERLITLQTQ